MPTPGVVTSPSALSEIGPLGVFGVADAALARTMRELSLLTCLVIFLYDAPTATSCRSDEHTQIVTAVGKRDQVRAEKLMLDHLDHIEHSLQLDPAAGDTDLAAIFGP